MGIHSTVQCSYSNCYLYTNMYIYIYSLAAHVDMYICILYIYTHVYIYIYMAFGYEGNGKAVFKKESRIVWVAVKVSR